MKGIIFTATVLLLLFIVIGCTVQKDSSTATTTLPVQDVIVEALGDEVLFINLAEALDSGEMLKCDAKISENEAEIWIDGETLYYKISLPDTMGNVLYLADKAYAWAQGDDFGIVLDINDMNEQARQMGTYQTRFLYSKENLNSISEDTQCVSVIKADSSRFNTPAGIMFKDRDSLMQEMVQDMENLN